MLKMKSKLFGLAMGAFLASAGGTAFAAAAACNPQGTGNDLGFTDDVKVNSIESTSCAFIDAASDSEGLLNTSPGFAGFTNWDFQWKTDIGTTTNTDTDGGALGDLQLSISNLTAGNTGTFTLLWTGGPQTVDMAIILKSAAGLFGYFFDDFLFNPASGSYPGSYEVSFKNNNDVGQALSHISVYTGGLLANGNGNGNNVPEPATLALVGLGLLGAAAVRRRRRG